MPNLTVVAPAFARVGERFRYRDACEEAEGCPVAKLCQSQEPGQTYRVTKVRPVVHDVCGVFEGGAQVVEVEREDPVASFPAGRLKGTLVEWSELACTKRGCSNWTTCFNPAMRQGGRYEVLDDLGTMECPMGYDLRRVRARPAAGANA